VRVKAKVLVDNPVDFYNNLRNIDIRTFFNNQFSLDVAKITRKYSIMEYSGIDEELTAVLTSSHVADSTTGLSYQIQSVITEPNAEAKALLKTKDDMHIRAEMTQIASGIAQHSRGKSVEEAVWEEAAQGRISDTDAINKIEDYKKKGYLEKITMLIQLRDDGFISDAATAEQVQMLLPASNAGTKTLPSGEVEVPSGADEYYDE
jgi:hypothetical protein